MSLPMQIQKIQLKNICVEYVQVFFVVDCCIVLPYKGLYTI